MKKICLLLLCLAMVVCAVGCETSKKKQPDDTANSGELQTTDADQTNFAEKYQSLDLEGYEFTLLTRNCCASHVHGFYVDNYESSNKIDESVFRRNMAVEENLDCFLNYTTIPDAYPEALVTAVSSDTKICDVAMIHAQYIGAVALSGYLMDLGKNAVIEWDHPWWNEVVIRSNSINGHFFAGRGILDVNSLTELSCLYFNKDILTNNFGSDYDLFQIVLDGDWTIDLMYELATQVGRDLNSDGKIRLEDDQFGFITEPGYMNIWQYALGQMTTTRDENGLPILYGYTTRMDSIVSKMRQLTYHESSWCETNSTTSSALRRTLFMMGQLSDVINDESFVEMQNIYGIIPLPKYNSDEEYVSHAVGHSDQFGIPTTTLETVEPASYVLEALSYYGYQIMRPAVYDVALHYRYVSDEYSGGAMLDIILASVTSDFAEFATASDQSLLHKQTYILDKLAGTNNSIGYNGYLKTLAGASDVLAEYVQKFQYYVENGV